MTRITNLLILAVLIISVNASASVSGIDLQVLKSIELTSGEFIDAQDITSIDSDLVNGLNLIETTAQEIFYSEEIKSIYYMAGEGTGIGGGGG
jgi:hypothetical protein